MKLYSIRAEKTNGWSLYLCTTWRGRLTWTGNPSVRALVLPQKAANELMASIRDIVPEDWKLELVEELFKYDQDDVYYQENFPNV